MADGYIESAMLALTSTWSESGSGMSITCPQLSDALVVITRQVRSLYDDQVYQKRIIERHHDTITALTEELQMYRQQQGESDKLLTDLSCDTTGFARSSALTELAMASADKVSVTQVKDELKRLNSQVSHNMASKRDVDDMQRELRALQLTVEEHRKDVVDDSGTLRKMHAQLEVDTRRAFNEISARVGQVEGDLGRRIDHLTEHTDTEVSRISNNVTLAASKASDALEVHTQEIVSHMTAHAEAIEALQTDRQERNRRMPTQHEVQQLRADMDSVKDDIHEALFRVQETYSQCQSMYAASNTTTSFAPAATGALRSVDKNTLLGSAAQQQRASSAVGDKGIFTPTTPTATTAHASPSFEQSSLLAEAQDVLLGIQASANLSQKDALPSSTELQLNVLKRDLHRVVTIAVPSCIKQVQTLKDQVEAVVKMMTRAESGVKGLAESVGLQDGGEELLASVLAQDYNKAILQVRTAFGVIAAGGYQFPSPRRGYPSAPEPAAEANTTATPKPQSTNTTPPPSDVVRTAGETGGHERYSSLPKLAALKSTQFSPTRTAPADTPKLGLDCADIIGGEGGGVVVMHVVHASAAHRAGILKGDQIMDLNKRPIRNCTEFLHVLSASVLRSQGELHCTLKRGSETKAMTIAM